MQTKLAPEYQNTAEGREAEAILRKCVHCGFCTATCPTYQLLGDELDGPRGRIYLMKQVLEGAEPTRKTQQHLDRCLTCRNCESTCPSGVQYGHLVDIGRKLVDAKVPRPAGEKVVRWALKEGLPSPLFAPAMKLGQLMREVLPESLKAKVPARQDAGEWPMRQHARKVLMLAGCVQPSMSTLRAWLRVGQSPAACGAGTLALRLSGNTLRTLWPSFMAGAKAGEGKPSLRAQRRAFSPNGRGTLSSTSLRPMSTRWPYCTPLGQVLSQLRQVRQRSRCSCVFSVGASPSSTCLIR